MAKGVLIVIDGVADLPCMALGKKTPLEAAHTPNLDFLASKGELGFMYPVKEDYAPESDTAVISILGNNSFVSSRGQLEALGAGIKMNRGDLALRTNFATITNLKDARIIDRRAGRTLTTKEAWILAKAISKQVKLPVNFVFQPTVQHRGILVLRGGFSDNITNTDPSYHVKGKFKSDNKFKVSQPLDDGDDNSEYTTDIVNKFIVDSHYVLEKHPINKWRKEHGLLPANIILTRDAGIEMPKLKKLENWAAVVYLPVERGIAKASGMSIFYFSYPKMRNHNVYGNLYDALEYAIKFSIKILKRKGRKFDYFYIHFKETDIPGHDGKPEEKKKMIELLDEKFFSFLKNMKNVKIAVTADHSTSCEFKSHTSDPVPVLIYDSRKNNASRKRFIEIDSKKGKLGKMYGKDFLEKIEFA